MAYPEQFQYMQAQAGPAGPRGSPGTPGTPGAQGFQGNIVLFLLTFAKSFCLAWTCKIKY